MSLLIEPSLSGCEDIGGINRCALQCIVHLSIEAMLDALLRMLRQKIISMIDVLLNLTLKRSSRVDETDDVAQEGAEAYNKHFRFWRLICTQ